MGTYLRNAWYPAAWSRDIGRALMKRRLLEEDVVLYRTEAGTVCALEDVCPHRLMPLSLGKLEGDTIQCGYHGLTFDCSGKCVRVPGQDVIPQTARVRAYPIHENMGLAWIWMGDPAKADPSHVFDLPQYHDASWSAVEGDALEVAANYLSLADNLCDPSHVSFVHLSTLGNAQSEDIPVHFEVIPEEHKVLTWRWIIDAPAIPLFQKFGNFRGNVDRWHYYHYYAPNIAIIDFGSALTGTGAPEGKRGDCIQVFACHFLTPVDESHSIDYWLHVKNFHADEAMNRALSDQFRLAFNEDKEILEAIEVNERRLPGRRQIRLAIDGSPIRMRKMVSDMIGSEAPTESKAA
ncbi:MAG: aromatic ring-hydroxylating dioxygenase subunit alpha [Methylobacteriaceae bacterium]|nr:aromatic ring-hydroxylating dioxygenase subunit alpha [Methylobacteriaceae bacterium]